MRAHAPTPSLRPSSVRLLLPLLLALGGAAPAPAEALPDATPGAPDLQPGEVIDFEQVARLRPYLPDAFWSNRDFFFYEGMHLEIAPPFADYGPPAVYTEATERFRGRPRVGPDDSLENYTAGQPFPMEEIDCRGDPQAGTKIMWNFVNRWAGSGGQTHFFYSYWDRGEKLPLYYEGTGGGVKLAHRPEPEYAEQGGDVFRKERRKGASGVDVTAPFDARGIKLLTYRYKTADGPRSEAQNDDTWVYVPSLRRVRRISRAQRTDAISGTDFTMDDLGSFAGIVPQYEWTCLEAGVTVAPSNTRNKGYPYAKDAQNFGPYGLSFADDRWSLRRTVTVRMIPKNADHPYSHKDIVIDAQTLSALYSFAYDRKGELWKIIWHNKRWSQDQELTGEFYPGWPSVPEPRHLVTVSDVIVNVQTGTGNRIEFWDRHGTPLKSKGRIRRFIDVGRLTRGR